MQLLKGLLVLVSMFLLTGCILREPPVRGSGKIIAQPIDVTEFQDIEFSGAGKMVVEIGANSPSCIIEVDDNLLEHIDTKVENGQLRIDLKRYIAPSKDLIVRITTPSLRHVSISGSCESQITGLAASDFGVDASGSTKVQCSGTADNFKFSVSGSGDLKSDELECKNVSIDVSGSGKAVVHAAEKLDVNISGSGSVRYLGSPEVTKNVSGSGSIEPLQ